MSQRPKIHCRIAKDGNVTIVDVTGAGASCLDATASLEKALGIVDEKSREKTASAFQDVDPLKLTCHTE